MDDKTSDRIETLLPIMELMHDPYIELNDESRYLYSVEDQSNYDYQARVDNPDLRDWIVKASKMGKIMKVEDFMKLLSRLSEIIENTIPHETFPFTSGEFKINSIRCLVNDYLKELNEESEGAP